MLQVCYYIYRVIAFNNKNSLHPSRREYISVLNCGQNVQVNCFFEGQAILQSVRKLAKKNFFAFHLFLKFDQLLRHCLYYFTICSYKKIDRK